MWRTKSVSEHTRVADKDVPLRRQQIRPYFDKGQASAGLGVLEHEHVGREGVLPRERLQTIQQRQHDRRA